MRKMTFNANKTPLTRHFSILIISVCARAGWKWNRNDSLKFLCCCPAATCYCIGANVSLWFCLMRCCSFAIRRIPQSMHYSAVHNVNVSLKCLHLSGATRWIEMQAVQSRSFNIYLEDFFRQYATCDALFARFFVHCISKWTLLRLLRLTWTNAAITK